MMAANCEGWSQNLSLAAWLKSDRNQYDGTNCVP